MCTWHIIVICVIKMLMMNIATTTSTGARTSHLSTFSSFEGPILAASALTRACSAIRAATNAVCAKIAHCHGLYSANSLQCTAMHACVQQSTCYLNMVREIRQLYTFSDSAQFILLCFRTLTVHVIRNTRKVANSRMRCCSITNNAPHYMSVNSGTR
jgi:hypothetical protein